MNSKRQSPEQDLHFAVADFLHAVLSPPVIWSTIGHGGGGPVRGAILKRMGLRVGIPDIMIFWTDSSCPAQPGRRGRPSFVLGIELKAKKGIHSEAQKEWAQAATLLGHGYALCHAVEDVLKALDEWHCPHRKVK